MKLYDVFVALQQANHPFIEEEALPRTPVPEWYSKLYRPNASAIDRYYLEKLYPNSELIDSAYDSVFQFQTMPAVLTKNEYMFNNMYRTIIQDYNPIDNYDRTEETDVVLDGNNTNTTISESTNVKTGSETDNTTGSISNIKTGSETDNTTGSISNTKSGNSVLAKTGDVVEETMDSGTETHTQNVNTESTNQTRAFNSGLVDTAKSKTATPTANTDILSFDNRKNLKSTGYNEYKETETYNDVSDISTYDNLNHETTFNNVSDVSTYDNLKRETTFNNVTDTNNQTSTAEGTVSNTTKTTSKIHGNIGVTTTAQMLEGERNLSKFDFIDFVMKTIIFEVTEPYIVEEWSYDN